MKKSLWKTKKRESRQTRGDTILVPRQETKLVPKTIAAKDYQATKQGKKFRLKQPPKPKSIKPLERSYFNDLQKMNEALQRAFERYIAPQLPSIIRVALSGRPQEDSLKVDAYDDMLDQAFNDAKASFFREYTDEELQNMATRIAGAVNVYNLTELKQTFKVVLGIDYMNFEPWLVNEITAFTKENISLIKTIPSQFFDQLEQQVLREIQAGTLTSEIASGIEKYYGATNKKAKKRAALIARDQVNKFNGNLDMKRQMSVGIKKYIWVTSGDERVRPEHRARNGETFKWTQPPFDGHPGQPINCRCRAKPVFEE